ncbi:MAG: ribosome maturation factor RimM [Acidimicrobiia bacterium]
MPESNSSTDPDGHVLVGIVGKAHGLAGHVFVMAQSDNPERFAPGALVGSERGEMAVESSRSADGRLIVKFSGVVDRTAAEALRGLRLTIPAASRRDLGEDEWWPDDLVGLRVVDHTGAARGVVDAIVEGVAQDRLAVTTTEGLEVEVPFVSELVPLVDIEAGFVQLADVEGLLTEP